MSGQHSLKRPKSKSKFHIIEVSQKHSAGSILSAVVSTGAAAQSSPPSLPHLDGAVQRGLVQLLELRPDVLQVELRPSHHDSGQSGLVGSAALTTTRARLCFAVDTEKPLNSCKFTFMLLYSSSAK